MILSTVADGILKVFVIYAEERYSEIVSQILT